MVVTSVWMKLSGNFRFLIHMIHGEELNVEPFCFCYVCMDVMSDRCNEWWVLIVAVENGEKCY